MQMLKVNGYASLIVSRKPKSVKESKKWNKEVFSDVKVKKYNLLGIVSSFNSKRGNYRSNLKYG